MTDRIDTLAKQCWSHRIDGTMIDGHLHFDHRRFAELIVKECIDKIETYRIPVGNSASGELACEWTYAALKEIRDEIKEHFAVD